MTTDVNEHYGFTMHHAERVGAERWVSTTYIFRRDTQRNVDSFSLGGPDPLSCEDNARVEAYRRIGLLSQPPDWIPGLALPMR